MNQQDKPVLLKKIHVMIIKKVDFENKIERCKFFEILSERIGRITEEEKEMVLQELERQGFILGRNKYNLTINRDF